MLLYKLKKHIKICFILIFPIISATHLLAQSPKNADTPTDNLINLNEVVVTATRSNKTLKNTPIITQVITKQQIEKRGITDIQSLLMQEVPGISFQEVGFGTSIEVQGLGAKHILFLIDGERLSGETGSNIDYSRINMSNVERIEIVKGASSAIYGSQAMGGVINIITKNPNKKFDVHFSERYAQANQINFQDNNPESSQYKFRRNADLPNTNGNLSVGIALGKFKSFSDVQFKTVDAYQLYDTDSLTKYFPTFDSTIVENKNTTAFNIAGYQNINVSQKFSYDFNNKLSLSVKGTFFQMNKYDLVANNKFEQNKDYTLGAYLNYNLDNLNNLLVSFYTDHYNRYDKYELIDGKNLIYKSNLVHPKAVYTSKNLTNQTLTAGLEFFKENLTTDMFDDQGLATKSIWSTMFFAQDDWQITENINMIAGVRADYHEQYKSNFTPKLSLLYRLQPFTIRANYAMGYRSPTLKELYMNWDHLGMFQIYGNKDLKPESNNYVSLSGEYVSQWLYATVSGYGNWFENKIEGIWSNNQTEYRYVNFDKSFLSGINATAKIKIVNNLYFNGALSYLYVDKTNGVKLSAASPLSGNMRVEYNFHRTNYNASLSLASSIYGQKRYSVEDELSINGITQKAFYDVHVDTYSLWNLAFSQQFHNSVRLTLGVDNLLNYKANIVNFNTSTTPGRRWYIALNTDIAKLASIFK